MKKNWIVAAVICLMAAAALYQNIVKADESPDNRIEEAPKPGFRAPSFELTGIDGKTYKVGGERNKPLLLNFWASWCGPCHIEAPDLQSLYEKYEGRVDIYGINVTSLDTKKGAQKFIDEYGFTFPVPLDLDGRVTRQKYGVDGYPTTFLINQNGVVEDAVFGIINPGDLERKLDNLLDG